jgi:hypothetical protein
MLGYLFFLPGWRLRDDDMRTHPIAFVAIILLAVARTAEAEPILDQHYDPPLPPAPTFQFIGITPGTAGAQTFTVGIPGILARVDVGISSNGQLTDPLLFDVRPTVNGVPVEAEAAALFSAALAQDQLPFPAHYVTFDVSAAHIPVVPGEVLAIVLRNDAQWDGLFGDPNPGGRRTGGFPLLPRPSLRCRMDST